jgi:APA family basic amino acid/polyamine antiporter
VSFAIGDVPSWGALGASMVLVMFAYSGMETALVPSGELNDPARDVPRATMVAILLVVLLYLALQVVGQGLLGAGLAKSGVPVADTAARCGRPARAVAGYRVPLDGRLPDGQPVRHLAAGVRAGRDGYLPRIFGTVSAAHRVPLWALAVHATLAWVLAIAGNFDALALISGGAICLVYGLVCLAAWRAQARDIRERGDAPFVLPGGFVIPLVAIAAMVAITATLTRKEWLAIGIALAVLVVSYALLGPASPRPRLERRAGARLHPQHGFLPEARPVVIDDRADRGFIRGIIRMQEIERVRGLARDRAVLRFPLPRCRPYREALWKARS